MKLKSIEARFRVGKKGGGEWGGGGLGFCLKQKPTF